MLATMPTGIAVDVRETADQGLAVARLEFLELAASTTRAMISRTSKGRRVSFGTMPYSSSASYRRLAGRLQGQRQVLFRLRLRHDVAGDAQRVLVVFGEVVGHARNGGVHVGAAQAFGIDHFAGGGLHQRRAAEEDGALFAHDDGFVAHRRHVGAAGGAASP